MRILRRILLVASGAVAMAVASGAPGQPATSLSMVLAQARVAYGGAAVDRVCALHTSGRASIAGISGTYDQWSDCRSGSYAETDNAGPFTGAEGFDGTKAWNRDSGGVTWVDGGMAGYYSGIATAYVINHDLVRPKRRGSVTLLGSRQESGRGYDVLRATPPGGLPMDIWLDAKTHLPARAIVTIGVQTTTFTFDSYRSVDGLKIPFHLHSVSDSGNETDATVTQTQANPPDLADHLKMTATQPNDFAIGGSGQTSVPIQVIDNHVYIDLTLNGKGPYRFAFDTGGSNLLDDGVARDLGLTTMGSFQGSGVGAKTEGIAFAKIDTLAIGGATLSNQYFAVLPIRKGFSVAAGVPIDGLIGFEVLARFITTFDYGHLRVTFALPSAATAQPSGADVVPFVFNDTIPQVPCLLDGVSGDCSVDTGSRLSATVLTPFSAAHPQVVPANATAPGIDGFGIGGAAIGRLGRLQSLQIGNTALSDLITDFSVQRKGYFGNPFIAANVGGGVWRRFTVTFDYSHQLMTLVPNSEFNARESYDRSGLFLVEPATQPVVADARPGTPAAEAGLTAGDTVLAIDGKSTTGMDLLDIRRMLREPAGTVIHLTVQDRSGAQRSLTLTLRDYV